jgi:hypothetical protein
VALGCEGWLGLAEKPPGGEQGRWELESSSSSTVISLHLGDSQGTQERLLVKTVC